MSWFVEGDDWTANRAPRNPVSPRYPDSGSRPYSTWRRQRPGRILMRGPGRTYIIGVAHPSPNALPKTQQLVVVVDDEPQMRRIMAGALQDHYRILTAESGEEVLALFGAMGRDISAVVTDIRMPGMDGLALAAALRDLGISVPILFVSGFGVVGEAPGPFLAKPFLPDDLLAAVQRLLDDVEGDD